MSDAALHRHRQLLLVPGKAREQKQNYTHKKQRKAHNSRDVPGKRPAPWTATTPWTRDNDRLPQGKQRMG